MSPLFAAENLSNVWELLCYGFTALGVAISFLTTLRA